eukprot:803944_1
MASDPNYSQESNGSSHNDIHQNPMCEIYDRHSQILNKWQSMADQINLNTEKGIAFIDSVLTSLNLQDTPPLQNNDDNTNGDHPHHNAHRLSVPEMLDQEFESLKLKLNHKLHENEAMVAKEAKQSANIADLRSKVKDQDDSIEYLTFVLQQRRAQLDSERSKYHSLQTNYNTLQEQAGIPENERLVFETNQTNHNESSDDDEDDDLKQIIIEKPSISTNDEDRSECSGNDLGSQSEETQGPIGDLDSVSINVFLMDMQDEYQRNHNAKGKGKRKRKKLKKKRIRSSKEERDASSDDGEAKEVKKKKRTRSAFWTKKEEKALIKGYKKYRKYSNRSKFKDGVFSKICKDPKYKKVFAQNKRTQRMIKDKWYRMNRKHKFVEKWEKKKSNSKNNTQISRYL